MSTEAKNKDQKSSYRGIFKATSLFGGVKVYEILIEIIKSKFIAVLLGPAGVGIQGLYTSGTHMIQQLSSFGLSQSAVRNVAEAYGSNDEITISKTVTALRKLVMFTGLLGMIIVIVLSPILSKSSFGDDIHIWGFIALSVTLLFSQVNAGQKVILQGTRKYRYLAKCTAIGMTFGLFVSVPLYYFFGINAIVPNIIIGSITSLILSWYYSKKVYINSVSLTYKETLDIGRAMLSMGITMSLTQFLSLSSAYLLRSCIRMWGGIEEVGLYTAGFLLMSQYTGLVFQAMGTDFYPRLAAVNRDNEKCKEIMNQQGEVGFLLLGPLMVLCVVFIPVVVRLLYSEKFLPVNDYIVCCTVGVIFQMAAWSISYVFIAKAEKKVFAVNELTVGIYGLLLNLLGYYWGGLVGMGISFSVKYLIYFVQVYFIARTRYGFSMTDSYIRLFIIQIVSVLLGVIFVTQLSSLWRYLCGSLLFIVVLAYSFFELNRRIEVFNFIKSKIQKK